MQPVVQVSRQQHELVVVAPAKAHRHRIRPLEAFRGQHRNLDNERVRSWRRQGNCRSTQGITCGAGIWKARSLPWRTAVQFRHGAGQAARFPPKGRHAGAQGKPLRWVSPVVRCAGPKVRISPGGSVRTNPPHSCPGILCCCKNPHESTVCYVLPCLEPGALRIGGMFNAAAMPTHYNKHAMVFSPLVVHRSHPHRIFQRQQDARPSSKQ